ncbi:MAG: polysaccharide pyruvyl transferase family protein [Oscillospiraceae bacterium]|jgi:coenzyme F420-reducing hydrogenase beta subunit|nr:polysaccharide pyruvyl transferase family protein [Oscillospiraceae bacterium]
MTIGIITFINTDNFGAIMQAYALSSTLKKFGHNVYVIRFMSEYTLSKSAEYFSKKNLIKTLNFQVDKLNFTDIILTEPNKNFAESLKKYNLDMIICGSDQIWSDSLIPFNPIMYGGNYNHIDNRYNVILASYAASLGNTDLTDERVIKKMQYFLHNFDYISIREKSDLENLQRIVEQPVEVNIDPTLLIDSNDYKEVIGPRLYNDSYVYGHYYWNEHLEDKNYFLAQLLEKTKMPVGVSQNYTQNNNFNIVFDGTDNFGVEDNLSAIYYANYVVTQSFHCVVFCLHFKKKFWYVLKQDRTDTRIVDLLTSVGLEDRIINGKVELPENYDEDIDWIKVTSKLWNQKKSSIDYLLKITQTDKSRSFQKDYLQVPSKFKCYCCSACADICPKNAIEMVVDDEGFSYPKIIEEKCINCGICHKTCPHNNKPKREKYEPIGYIGYAADDETRVNSSSGGIYQVMANYVLEQGGSVIGVKYDENFVATYDIAETKEQSYAFRYSKYVEPKHGDIYNKTKTALETGKLVLFTGSPCKVAGLKNFLKKEYDNLFTAEIICHSTCTPKILKQWLDFIQTKENSELIYFTHRTPKAPTLSHAVEYRFKNDNSYVKDCFDDAYMKRFLNGLSTKYSCFQCQFCYVNSTADIVFGDFFGDESKSPENAKKGISCVIANNQHGKKFIENIKDKFELKETKAHLAIQKNHIQPNLMKKERLTEKWELNDDLWK